MAEEQQLQLDPQTAVAVLSAIVAQREHFDAGQPVIAREVRGELAGRPVTLVLTVMLDGPSAQTKP